MTSPEETAQRIRSALEPYVRPREEAAAIRRVLKAHLAASLRSRGGDDSYGDDDVNDINDVLDGSSLALVNLPWDTAIGPEARGLQKKYLLALQANLDARRAFGQRVAEAASTSALASSTSAGVPLNAGRWPGASSGGGGGGGSSSVLLQEHLVTVKLGRKQARLQTVNRYLDALAERPVAVAAGEDYLQPEFIYGDAETTLPSVPREVVDGLAEDEAAAPGSQQKDNNKTTTTTAGLEKLVAQLEKSALRSKLALHEEEKRLAAARAKSAQREAITRTSRAAKLQALGTARDALIGWMETELGNAAKGEEERTRNNNSNNDPDGLAAESSRMLRQSLLGGGGGGGDTSGLGLATTGRGKAELGERLAEIQSKYAHYAEARRRLVDTVSSMVPGSPAAGAATVTTTTQNPLFANAPQLGPPQTDTRGAGGAGGAATETATAAAKAAALGDLLLVPYLERLLAVAHDQKAGISHKAHHNALLARRRKNTTQLLGHLADESQLLPRYGPRGSQGGAGREGVSGGGGVGGESVGGGGGGGGAAMLLRKKGLFAPSGRDDTSADSISQHVSAWTYAADSAKIATFESVFEQVEEGQVALEQATQALAEADMLLGRPPAEEEDAEDTNDNSAGGNKKHAAKRGTRPAGSGDIWAGLDGEVGLLKSDNR